MTEHAQFLPGRSAVHGILQRCGETPYDLITWG